MSKENMNKIATAAVLAGSVSLLGGVCFKAVETNMNIAGNSNGGESNFSTNVEQNGNLSSNLDLESFDIPELGVSIDMPFPKDQISFSEQVCGPSEGCDFDGYAFFGIYTPTGERGTGIIGSVSENWSPSRDGQPYEVFNLQGESPAFEVMLGNGKTLTLEEITSFEIDEHSVVLFDLSDSIFETDAYLGVFQVSTEGKYRAAAFMIRKSEISEENFLTVLHSIRFH